MEGTSRTEDSSARDLVTDWLQVVEEPLLLLFVGRSVSCVIKKTAVASRAALLLLHHQHSLFKRGIALKMALRTCIIKTMLLIFLHFLARRNTKLLYFS